MSEKIDKNEYEEETLIDNNKNHFDQVELSGIDNENKIQLISE